MGLELLLRWRLPACSVARRAASRDALRDSAPGLVVDSSAMPPTEEDREGGGGDDLALVCTEWLRVAMPDAPEGAPIAAAAVRLYSTGPRSTC